MKKTLINYSNKISKIAGYYDNVAFDNVNTEIKKVFAQGIYFIQRNSKTNVTNFMFEFGYKLPDDVCDYVNLYWHPWISGYVSLPECIVLFSVLKHEDESDDDILYQRNGLISMAREWSRKYR